jgi:hypothetical protein
MRFDRLTVIEVLAAERRARSRQNEGALMEQLGFFSNNPPAGWNLTQIEEAILRQSLSVTIQREVVRRAANNGLVPATELDTLAELERELAELKKWQHLLG